MPVTPFFHTDKNLKIGHEMTVEVFGKAHPVRVVHKWVNKKKTQYIKTKYSYQVEVLDFWEDRPCVY